MARGRMRSVEALNPVRAREVGMAMLMRMVLCTPLLFGLLLAPPEPARCQPADVGSPVKIVSATKVFVSKDKPAYLVAYSYDFARFSTVYIDDLGRVPGKGRYAYLSVADELTFRDVANGTVLARVPLRATAVVAAKPPLNEIETSFPDGYRSFVWDRPASLQERANLVLAKYFLYLPRGENKLTYLATTYTPLMLDNRMSATGVQARVALMISFPYEESPARYSFRVQYSVKEGRALSDQFRTTSNADIMKFANGFVENLISELKEGQ
jgi:hypothetical protein